MTLLVADDDPVARSFMEALLADWGYTSVVVGDGLAALACLQEPDGPRLALLDWMMPGMTGVEVCQRLRAEWGTENYYLILVSTRGAKQDRVSGLREGADDFVAKPFDIDELRARIQVGERVLHLQHRLSERVHELEAALAQVKQLRGLLPICSYCKKVRDDQNYWQQVEGYVVKHAEVRFSHGICPDCYRDIVQPELEKLTRSKEA
jgi:DNA-binding response OmpR family regulator